MTEVRFQHSTSLPEVLTQSECSLLLSTYQAGQLVGVGVDGGAVNFSFHRFDQPMGVAVGADQIAAGVRSQVWHLRDHSEIAVQLEPRGRYDRCFLAQSSTVTGDFQGHELAWGVGSGGDPELWIVNTVFSCLATIHPDYNFVPRWRPTFISELAAEDRCHLNGLAMREGTPAFVTVMARSDAPAGWRTLPKNSGAVMDVASGETVTTGLEMPHSPRWHDEKLFVLTPVRVGWNASTWPTHPGPW